MKSFAQRIAYGGAYDHAMEFLKVADMPSPYGRDNRDASYKPRKLSSTFSNARIHRPVDPALQIGGPGRDGLTAKIYDPRVEQAYRKLLKSRNMVSPRDEKMYAELLWQARNGVYGPE